MFANVPGTRAAMRAGIYWLHEAVGFAMTQQPRLLKIGELLGKWNIRRVDQGQGAAPQAHPGLPGRL